MNENNVSVTIPLSVYNELVRVQTIAGILRNECKVLASYDFAHLADRLLNTNDAGDAAGEAE